MKRLAVFLLLVGLLASAACAADAVPVKIIDEVWRDASRNRDVPVRIYLPQVEVEVEVAGQSVALPVIIFSHGLGGTRESYAYLAEYWSSHGYVCVHPQHAGSDETIYMNGDTWNTTVKALKDPAVAISRPADVSFVISRLEEENRPGGKLAGRLDLSRLGVGGHSFGAFTALAMAGQRFANPEGGGGGGQLSFVDKRVKAAIAISERPSTAADPAKDFAEIRIPMLHITGTLDYSPLGDVQPKERRQPFDLIPAAAGDQYLVIFDGAAHLTFSGQRPRAGRPMEAGVAEVEVDYLPMVQAATLRFWDAYLKGDAEARRGLQAGGLKQLIRPVDQTETRLQRARP